MKEQDYIDRCLDEGLLTDQEYEQLIEDGECFGEPELCVPEAARAVAAYILGRPIESVSIDEWRTDDEWQDPDGTVWLSGEPMGKTVFAQEPQPEDTLGRCAMAFRAMLIAMAPGIANYTRSGTYPKDGMSSTDRKLVFDHWLPTYGRLTGNDEADVARELWAEVGHIVCDNWDLVSGLAAVLMYQPYLSGPQVYEIFDRIRARRAPSDSARA